MNYTLHQLKIFLEVCKMKSITKAADALHLTQPAVSIQLKKLQEQFEVPLTEVIGRKLHVTDFGKQLAIASERVVAEANAIDLLSHKFKGLMVGKITISIVSTAKYVLPYFLNDFVKKYPQIDIQVDVTNKRSVIEHLKQNDTDFALVSVLPNDVLVNVIELMDNKLFLVGSSTGAERLDRNEPLSAKEVAQLPLIFREEGSATRAAMERFLRQAGAPINKRLELVSNEAVKQAVNADLGYSVMPLIGLKNEIQNDSMRIIPTKGLPITTTWNLIYNKNKGLLPASTAMIEYIEAMKDEIINKYFSWYDRFELK